MKWAELESDLHPEPEFFVQEPDDLRDWSEIDRQATFLKLCRHFAPRVMVFANANAGKRNPRLAKKEGLRAGVFDLSLLWRAPQVCYLEMKGYDKSGRAGKLSDAQVEFGNRCHQLGIPAAMFFCPYEAARWCKRQGLPFAEIRDAA